MDLQKNEQIKQIDNFPNYYITNFGRVWSDKTHRWLKPTENKRGNHCRCYVSLGRGNKKYVHQLVAQAFVDNPFNLTEVDHIDGNAMNNHADNLRWVTHNQNMQNNITEDRLKKNTGYCLWIENIETGEKYLGYAAAAEASGLHVETIRNHTKGRVKNPKWRIIDEKRVNPKGAT